MKIEYIAEDGTRFDDEYECKDHERKMRYSAVNDAIVGLDGNTLIFFSDPTFCLRTDIIYLATQDLAEIFIARCEDEGITITGIDGPGYYLWDEIQWENIQVLVAEHNAKISELTKFMNTLKDKAEV